MRKDASGCLKSRKRLSADGSRLRSARVGRCQAIKMDAMSRIETARSLFFGSIINRTDRKF
ncbi:hypothetical protein CD113_10615 [Staphylococcus simiae]|nr:hypothetical protein CD113_10615 [Staphylococcus simiae]